MKAIPLIEGKNTSSAGPLKRVEQRPGLHSRVGGVLPSGRQSLLKLASLFLAFLAGSGTAWGQATTSVRGTVTDPSGSAVAGATVTIANSESKTERTATTSSQGEYQFLLLPPGTYALTVTVAGFSRFEQTGLQLLVNTPATANVQLKLGQSTQSVTVTSEALALNMVDASLGNSVGEKQLKQVPLEGRNVPDLLTLQPGVVYTGNNHLIDKDNDTRSGSVNGARSDQSNVSLDGVDVNDQAYGYAFTSVLPVTLDSVQEFRVTTTNYNADQGQGSGAQVALVTKGGTNSLHGSAYEYTRNTITSANDYFVKLAELGSGQPNKAPKLIRNIFGASLGGPVRKDRLFFFANYEGTRQREEHSVVRVIPSVAMRDGVIQYPCEDSTACPASSVNGISGNSYAVPAGYFGLSPAQLTKLDPLTAGPNPAMLAYFNSTYSKFVPNDPSVGDGFNYAGYRFRAPFRVDNNALIARVDYNLTSSGKHTLFWRGALQNLFNPQELFLPGTPSIQSLSNHSKGSVVGYTSVFSSTLANTLRWGFTRQSVGYAGDTNEEWNTFTGLDQGLAYSHSFQLPVHSILDDLSWTKGTHSLQFGANLGFARDPRISSQHSFNQGLGFTSWMSPTGFANAGSPLDPQNNTNPVTDQPYPQVQVGSEYSYDLPMLGLLGMVSDVRANYNLDKQGNLIKEGTPIARNYGLNWYEFYGQDSWRIKPNLTLTYGLRWSLFPPPWEVNGFQASPTTSIGAQFNQNIKNMQQGIGYDSIAPISFGLGGKANNGPGFYHFEKTDFSPRISIAYTPRLGGGLLKRLLGDGDKTVIRAGFSKVYDRAGLGIINTFDTNAPAGLSTTLQNPCCVDGAGQVARVTSVHGPNAVPTQNANGIPYLLPPPSPGFPQTPASGYPAGEAIAWGVDDTLKTPHSYAVDFSIGRELPKRFSLQLSYVGRFSHKLLTQRDLMQPLNIKDPKSGIDYNTAATVLSKLFRAGTPISQVTAQSVGPTAAYWQNLLPASANGYSNYVPSCAYNTTDIVQEVYAIYTCFPYVEVLALGWIDYYGGLADGAGNSLYFGTSGSNTVPGGVFLNNQFSSLYAWSSVGNAGYNALQASLRKQFSNGVQFDLNYTFSKSIDITSTATRVGYNGGLSGSSLANAFSPNQFRGVSDFDSTHQINATWRAELPFGKGRSFGRNASGILDGFIGGWELSGVARWTSGFPFSVDNGQSWPTDWNYQGLAQMMSAPKVGVFKQPNGSVNMFGDLATAAAVRSNDFIHPFPGQSGSRNTLRGPGTAGWDMNLSKSWKLPKESQSLQFRWEVFNVPNLKRFNVQSNPPSLTQNQSFGNYTGLLTEPRVMQFALRYDF